MNNQFEVTQRLVSCGIAYVDACALRRISMTLHRWHELECGDGNDYASWCITRGRKVNGTFEYDETGQPYEERHVHTEDKPRYTRLADREGGAIKRLKGIMAKYPAMGFYIQGDPRGASLYIIRPGDIREGSTVDSCYSNGVAVYQ
jgi:hypothetical protein